MFKKTTKPAARHTHHTAPHDIGDLGRRDSRFAEDMATPDAPDPNGWQSLAPGVHKRELVATDGAPMICKVRETADGFGWRIKGAGHDITSDDASDSAEAAMAGCDARVASL